MYVPCYVQGLKNACRLLESIAQLEDDKGQERDLIEV